MNSSTLSILRESPLPGFGGRRFKAVCAVTLAVSGLFFGGCASYSTEQNVDLFVRTAPVPQLVPHGKELAQAEKMAAGRAGDIALKGVGSSMEPMYVSGTAIVVRPCSYMMLRKGQPVVYQNRRGYYVAHMLVEETSKGWIAIGINNKEPDSELVTPENLVGLIKEAFAASDTTFRQDVAARIAMREGLNRGVQVSLLR